MDSNNCLPDILQKGLGRAFEHIKHQNSDRQQIKTDLLNACLHNLAYDPQCEPGRAEYLFELISLIGDLKFYRTKIFQALPISKEFWDINQLYDLVLIWAKRGDTEAQKIIYQTFSQQEDNASWLGGNQIIELDGIRGLLTVAEIVGKRLLKDEELWEDDWLISQARESYGVDRVNLALAQAASSNIEVKAYLDAVQAHEANNKINKAERQRQGTKYKNIKLDYILRKIAEPKCYFHLLNKFGVNASDRDLETVFDLLLKETQKEKLIRYLWIFKNRPLPRLDSRLFALAKSEDEEIRYCAIAALANNKSELIRSLAISLIDQSDAVENRVLSLFINNYQVGDYKIIESALTKYQSMEFRHAAGMDLMNIIEAQKNPELLNCSFWIYNNTPCAHCRESILEILMDSKQITLDILEECLCDSSTDIRALAKKYLVEHK